MYSRIRQIGHKMWQCLFTGPDWTTGLTFDPRIGTKMAVECLLVRKKVLTDKVC